MLKVLPPLTGAGKAEVWPCSTTWMTPTMPAAENREVVGRPFSIRDRSCLKTSPFRGPTQAMMVVSSHRLESMTDLSTRLAEIRSLEEAPHRPSVRRSRDALEQLLAKDFVKFGSSGSVHYRDELIARLVQEDNERDVVRIELGTCDYTLTSISADAALLTYRTHHKESD